MAQGPGFHCTAEDQIREVLRAEGAAAPVVSSAGALLDGLRALGARRIAMVTPYEKPLTKLVAEYVEAGGVEVHDALSLEVANNLEVAALDPLALQEHWRKRRPQRLRRARALRLRADALAALDRPRRAGVRPARALRRHRDDIRDARRARARDADPAGGSPALGRDRGAAAA